MFGSFSLYLIWEFSFLANKEEQGTSRPQSYKIWSFSHFVVPVPQPLPTIVLDILGILPSSNSFSCNCSLTFILLIWSTFSGCLTLSRKCFCYSFINKLKFWVRNLPQDVCKYHMHPWCFHLNFFFVDI
jgi:hypothetical protein